MRLVLVVSLVFLASVPAAQATGFFTGLGELAGADGSSAVAISSDGTTVVGASGGTPFRWTAIDGMMPVATPPDVTSAAVRGVSADGSVIVGSFSGPTAAGWSEAYRWTEPTGMVGLGVLPGEDASTAAAVSADGSVVVGTSGGEAFRWTPAGGMVGLGVLPAGDERSFSSGTDVSDDGAVAVGHNDVPMNESLTALRWTSAGMMPIGSGEDVRSSPDGNVVVGDFPNGRHPIYWRPNEAFVWTAATRHLRLGFLHPLDPDDSEYDYDRRTSWARAASNGGLVIGVSCAGGEDPGPCEGFLWDLEGGMRPFEQELEEVYGLDLAGWSISPVDVSADGRTFVGTGRNPNGVIEAWIAFIPEPGVATLLAVGLVALGTRRGRRA